MIRISPNLIYVSYHIFSPIINENSLASGSDFDTSIYFCIFCNYRTKSNLIDLGKSKWINKCEFLFGLNNNQRQDLFNEIIKITKFSISDIVNCTCPRNKLSCISEDKWHEKQYGVVNFQYSEIDFFSKRIHPAVFPIQLPKFFIELFTHKGEIVFDPFLGSGSTVLGALELNRRAIGFDLNSHYIDHCRKLISKLDLSFNNSIILTGDSTNLARLLHDESIKLVISSPPYANLISKKSNYKSKVSPKNHNKSRKYTNISEDLGNAEIEEYLILIENIFKTIWNKIKSNGHLILNICYDIYNKKTKRKFPFAYKIIQSMERIGYKFRNQLIWDRNGYYRNSKSFGYPSNFLIFSGSYEVLLHFSKK